MDTSDTKKRVEPVQLKIKQEISVDLDAEKKVKQKEAKFQPILIKPEPIDDDFKPKIEVKNENIALERGIEETLNLEINVPGPNKLDAIDTLESKRKLVQSKIKQEVSVDAENEVKKEEEKQISKPKIEVKKEEIAFERGIEETLNLEINSDPVPERFGNIRPKKPRILPKILQKMARNNVISPHENVKNR